MGDEMKMGQVVRSIKALEDRNKELEKILAAKEKIISVLMKRVERSVDTSGSAFSIFEQQILLENLVEQRTRELKEALKHIKTLSGLLPICSSCKNIRDDKGYWSQIERYISTHSQAEFTHSICPACAKKLYPDI